MKRTSRLHNNKPTTKARRTDIFLATPQTDEQKEKLADLIRRENEYLEAMRDFSTKATTFAQGQSVAKRSRRTLEDRIVRVLTFATSIELYRRFLEERFLHASNQLAEQLNDLDPYQKMIEIQEKSVETCSSMLLLDVNDDLESQNFDDELALDSLIQENLTRRTILELRKEILNRPSLIVPENPVHYEETQSIIPFMQEEELLSAELEVQKSQELLEKFSEKQKHLNETHFELEKLENEFASSMQTATEQYKMKMHQIDNLRNSISEIEQLQLSINEMNEKNARLQSELCSNLDNDRDARRNAAACTRITDRRDTNYQEVIDMKTRYEDSLKFAKKRRHQYNKRLQAKEEYEIEIKKMEQECEKKIEEVNQIEKQEHHLEMELNDKLKEMQKILTDCNEEATLENNCTPVSQIAELQKIINLVSNDYSV